MRSQRKMYNQASHRRTAFIVTNFSLEISGKQIGLLPISVNPFNYPSLLSFDTTPQCFTMHANHLPFAALHFFWPLFPVSHQRFQRTLLSSHSVSSHLPSCYQHPSFLATYMLLFFLNPSHTHEYTPQSHECLLPTFLRRLLTDLYSSL